MDLSSLFIILLQTSSSPLQIPMSSPLLYCSVPLQLYKCSWLISSLLVHKVQDKSLCDCLWFSFTLGIALALYLNHTLVSGKDRQLILHIVCGVEREPVSDFFAVMISDFKHSLGHIYKFCRY